MDLENGDVSSRPTHAVSASQRKPKSRSASDGLTGPSTVRPSMMSGLGHSPATGWPRQWTKSVSAVLKAPRPRIVISPEQYSPGSHWSSRRLVNRRCNPSLFMSRRIAATPSARLWFVPQSSGTWANRHRSFLFFSSTLCSWEHSCVEIV